MKTIIMTMSTLGVLLSAQAAPAAVAVFPTRGTNLQAGELEAIDQLFAMAYSAQAEGEVLAPTATRNAWLEARAPRAAAEKLGAAEYVLIRAIRLDSLIKITAARHRAKGERLHRVTMSAQSMDDMELVTQRLAQALIQRTAVDETQTIHNVTAAETRLENRLFTEKVAGIKTFGTFLLATGDRAMDPQVGLQFDIRLENRDYFLELGAGFMVPTALSDDKVTSGGLFAELGGSYYLIDGSISPYIGAGLIPKLLFGDHTDVGANLGMYAQAGVMFMRQNSTRFYIDFRASHDLFPWYADGDDPDFRVTNLNLQLGIGW